MTNTLTSASEVRAFWEEHAGYKYDPPRAKGTPIYDKEGHRTPNGRSRILAVGIEGHLIIGENLKDYALKLWSHELGIHRYCLPIPPGVVEEASDEHY